VCLREITLHRACPEKVSLSCTCVSASNSVQTCLFVDGKLRNAGASAPSGNVGSFVDQPLQRGAAPALVLHMQDDTEVLWQPSQGLYILLDQLGRPVVMIHDGIDSVADGIVCVAELDIEREEGMYEEEDKQMKLLLQELAYP